MRFSITVLASIYLIFLSFTSCAERCDNDDFAFRIRVELVLEHDETIEVNLRSADNEIHTVSQHIKGNSKSQFVELCLPEEPRELELHFSEKSKAKKVKIMSMLLENKDNQMFIEEPQRIYAYFVGNRDMKYNKSNKMYEFSQQERNQFTPVLKSREALKKRLRKRLNV